MQQLYDAPIDNVFEMWVSPDHLARWLLPVGCDMHVIKSEVSFAEEGADSDQACVIVVFGCSGYTSPEELAAVVAERGGMTQGWPGSFDKLED
ncbi:MAG: SRPBCC domain-containing protein [Candidatus Melainabacteria bacterium]|nr:SRPBCC domain-containing protein [Candidatus Melainabacteria bacterium]